LVEQLAAEGNPTARYLLDELDKSETALKAENIAAAALVADARAL
jgi:hypothetical protein